MTEADIKAELNAAELRAIALLERWAESQDDGARWAIERWRSPDSWRLSLESGGRTRNSKIFHGKTQHDAMAQAAQYIVGVLVLGDAEAARANAAEAIRGEL